MVATATARELASLQGFRHCGRDGPHGGAIL